MLVHALYPPEGKVKGVARAANEIETPLRGRASSASLCMGVFYDDREAARVGRDSIPAKSIGRRWRRGQFNARARRWAHIAEL